MRDSPWICTLIHTRWFRRHWMVSWVKLRKLRASSSTSCCDLSACTLRRRRASWGVGGLNRPGCCSPLVSCGVLPASRRWGMHPCQDTGQCKRSVCRKAEKTTLDHTEVGVAGHSCGGRPLSFAPFFVALHVSPASVLHSSQSAKRHRSTGSRGSGSGSVDALKYMG